MLKYFDFNGEERRILEALQKMVVINKSRSREVRENKEENLKTNSKFDFRALS